jgi:integrase
VPRIRLLNGERARDFVLSRKQEQMYLAACPQPFHDMAVLILETGLRIGEALNLEWSDVILEPIKGSRFGYLRVREGKSKNARRVVPLTDRASTMLSGAWMATVALSSSRTEKANDTSQRRSITFIGMR